MFVPDYKNIENAARNFPSIRIPLYEHIISTEFMERVHGEGFSHLYHGDEKERYEFFRRYALFQKNGI